MDRSSNTSTANAPPRSGIPRPPSKLPLPRAAAPPSLRPALSSEKLYSSSISELRVPRLRNSTSRDTLRPIRNNASRESNIPPPKTQTSSASTRREALRDVSTSTVIHTPSKSPTLKKSSSMLRSKISHDSFQGPLPESTPFETSAIGSGSYDIEGKMDDRAAHLRRARPSLSERTVETLAQLPPSPAVKNRGTSGGSRPGSSSNKDKMLPPTRSISSRPSSSSSQRGDIDFSASTNTARVASNTPKRPVTGSSFATPSAMGSVKLNFGSIRRSGQSKLVSPGFVSTQSRSPSPEKFQKLPIIKSGSKTISSRTIKPRASVAGLFRKPSMPTQDRKTVFNDLGVSASPTFSNTSSESTVSKDSRSTSASSASTVKKTEQTAAVPKGSLTLREQIAKAKAAKKAQTQTPVARSMSQTTTQVSVIPTETFDFGLPDDPFSQFLDQSGNKGLLRKRVDSARRDGRLNIAGMGLKEIPPEVMSMYDFESMGGGSWAENVDLTRFVAADNEFEILADEVFPDKDPREDLDDEDSKGSQFAGVETLDLHGNLLHTLPKGLCRLEFLTVLNLSNNKLKMDCFDILSQIPQLKDLKLNNNFLSGLLPDSISGLRSLEVLHVQKNTLTSLPETLADLVRLRVLNVCENMLETIPFRILQTLPLTEILASKNKLTGVLIEEGVKELADLQVLDVAGNSLTSLCTLDEILLPAMHQLNCGANRLTALPDMSSWTSLLILSADGNNISDLPEGFFLEKLKNVDLTDNNLKSLDERIGAMANLDVLRISGNPLREKKFSGMSTDDLKHALKMRMAPAEAEVEMEYEDEDTLVPQYGGRMSSTPTSPNRPSSPWPVKAGGVLDRSNSQSYSLNPVIAAQVASNNTIRTLELHHNLFREIPNSIAFFANTLFSLNLSRNELTSDTFLKDGLDLPFLKELNLSSNTFDSLLPLTTRFFAPNLESLDISFNRLTSLPILRTYFPNLRFLNASNNTIRDLNPESVKGLKALDCSSNELNSLNARIGLLGGPGGLERLDVRGNRFRVPRWEILEKGTEATLSWLRDKIPSSELSDLGETF